MMGMLVLAASAEMQAQSELYPKHFDLEQVTLLDGPMKTAMEKNFETLLAYDVDRLLTPYVRQSGLASTTDSSSPYYQWLTKHPNFTNWGDSSFDLSGHVGGHYLTALALAYAACHDEAVKAQLKERMDYMVSVMKDCQDRFDQNTQGLYGFIGGQPINSDWTSLYTGNISAYRAHGGWVPFYCQHKILAGLRDAFLYGNSDVAKEVFRKLADWSVNVVAKVSDSDMETLLNIEHGGMNESMLDAYQLFGDEKYLTAAKKYTHKTMLNGMQTLSTTFLDNKHANTQVPKYIGMERIGEVGSSVLDGSSQSEASQGSSAAVESARYLTAATNFWTDVAQNRTVCIGGNSVAEHFLAAANSNRYIDHLDGPESCNTNNMLKLSEMMSDRTADAKYADFYEQAMWNHILSTQDPETGGYVYFTTLRPQGYRIYSQVNQGMWCCVGTGMENHSKYGHFIYTHDGAETLYVNLFTPSRLFSDDFIVTQETMFPFEPKTTLTIGKAGTYTIAVRHPSWAGKAFSLTVNGQVFDGIPVEKGVASYVPVTRTWAVGDKLEVALPMELRYEVCPNYTDYVAFKYGPILLAAPTSTSDASVAEASGLSFEASLPNEYAGAGRMDHAPSSMASSKSLLSAPLLIGERADVLGRITAQDLSQLTFTIDASRPGVGTYKWSTLTLQPFYKIHHARYSCYWYQQTAENFANSDMAKNEAANEALLARTLDFVAPGEQQSEAGHEYNYSSDSSMGSYNGEKYRDARSGGYVQYTLYNKDGIGENLSVMCRFTTADNGRKAELLVDGVKIADVVVTSTAKWAEANGFYNIEYPIPASLMKDDEGKAKTKFVVRLAATKGTMNPGLYYLRLMKDYSAESHAYQFRANEWTTGDANRIAAGNITYDMERNVIKAKATGNNNIALMLKYQDCQYDIDAAQKFLVVRGKGLKINTATASYLWWLNGVNKGSEVQAVIRKNITVGEEQQQLIAWNMSSSGLYDNFTGDRPSVTMGKTIFGLTAANSDGSCEIYDINFAQNVDDYISTTTSVDAFHRPRQQRTGGPAYTLSGIYAEKSQKGIVIQDGKKVIK